MLEKIFQKNEKVFVSTYIIFKFPFIILSSYLGYIARFANHENIDLYIYPTFFICILTLTLELLFTKDVFYKKEYKFLFKEFFIFILSIILIISFSAALKSTSEYSRFWILIFIICYFIILLIYKAFLNFFYIYLINSNIFTKNIFIIGNFTECKKLIKKFANNEKFHIRLIGVKKLTKENELYPIQCVELNENIFNHLKYFQISQIWILNDISINKDQVIDFFYEYPIDIRTVIPESTHKERYITNLFDYNIYETDVSPFYGINFLNKYLFDKVFCILFLIIALPIIFIFGVLILIEDGRPIFFIQKRHGWDGKVINIYKIRSLKNSQNKKFEQVTEGDKRLLKVGKIIRRLSIDELPQLLNVLFGDLSIVGPRPHPIDLNNQYTKSIKGYMQRHRCKPGITGLAQVNGYRGPTSDPNLMLKRYQYDRKYIKNWSLLLDLEILIKTLFVFLFQKVD